MKYPPQCCLEKKDKIITLSENKSKISFHNPNCKLIYQITVDGCAITDGERCDYLVIRDCDHAEYYVELKGRDIKKACSQLNRTISILRSKNSKAAITCFVVSTHCPLTTTEVQLLKLQFKRKHNALLFVKNSPVEHLI